MQDAFAVAVERWPEHGVPPNTGAWLTTTGPAMTAPSSKERLEGRNEFTSDSVVQIAREDDD